MINQEMMFCGECYNNGPEEGSILFWCVVSRVEEEEGASRPYPLVFLNQGGIFLLVQSAFFA